jgi:hypothetical protein
MCILDSYGGDEEPTVAFGLLVGVDTVAFFDVGLG